MKSIIFLFAMSVSVLGCSQEKKQKMNTEITAENIVEKISEQVNEGEGMKYYEAGFYFDAQVPFENEGWSKEPDLTKIRS